MDKKEFLSYWQETEVLENPKFVVTLNLSHLRNCHENNEYMQMILRADLIITDGIPIKWILRKFLKKDVNRLTGVDLTTHLLEEEKNFVIIGSTLQNIDLTFRKNSFSQTVLAKERIWDEAVNVFDSQQIYSHVKRLEEIKPKIVLIALGVPKQDYLYKEMNDTGLLPPALYVGVGGTFEILSGKFYRAPNLIQNIGGEWLWRLIQEPKRLIPRYTKDFFWLIKFFLFNFWKKRDN